MTFPHDHASQELAELLAELGHKGFKAADFKDWSKVQEGVGKAVAAVRERLAAYPTLLHKVEDRFAELDELVKSIGEDDCNGVDVLAHLMFIILRIIPRV
jgi:hypothetical protein